MRKGIPVFLVFLVVVVFYWLRVPTASADSPPVQFWVPDPTEGVLFVVQDGQLYLGPPQEGRVILSAADEIGQIQRQGETLFSFNTQGKLFLGPSPAHGPLVYQIAGGKLLNSRGEPVLSFCGHRAFQGPNCSGGRLATANRNLAEAPPLTKFFIGLITQTP